MRVLRSVSRLGVGLMVMVVLAIANAQYVFDPAPIAASATTQSVRLPRLVLLSWLSVSVSVWPGALPSAF